MAGKITTRPGRHWIEEIDFNDHDSFMYAPQIKDFVEKYHLNPDPQTFNFRNILAHRMRQMPTTTPLVLGMVKSSLLHP